MYVAAITCSKLTIETLEQGVKYVQTPERCLLTLNIFHTFSSVSIVNFEHLITGREKTVEKGKRVVMYPSLRDSLLDFLQHNCLQHPCMSSSAQLEKDLNKPACQRYFFLDVFLYH